MKLIRSYLAGSIALLCTLSLTSCITLFGGKSASVTLTGQASEPVSIHTVRDSFEQQQLPATIQVRRSDLNLPIHIESDNYRYADLIPGRRHNGWSIAQIVGPFSIFGLIIDSATGNIFRPRQDIFSLTFVPKTDSIAQLTTVVPSSRDVITQGFINQRKERHELSIGIGIGCKTTGAYDELIDDLYSRYRIENRYALHRTANASISATYYYHFNKGLSIGATVGFHRKALSMDNSHHCTKDRPYDLPYSDYWYIRDDAHYYRILNLAEVHGITKSRMFFVLPSVKYDWFSDNKLSLYSRLSVGAAYRSLRFESDGDNEPTLVDRSGWQPAGQLCLLGMDLGRQHFKGFCELGIGHEGILRAGIAFHF